MSKTAKVLLWIAGVIAWLVVVVAIVGYFALNYLEKRLEEGSKADKEAGMAFAKTVDQKGCIDEGLKRAKAIGFLNMSQGSSIEVFVESCLKDAKPVDGFCQGVPGFWSMQDTEWKVDECHKVRMDEQKTGCTYVFSAKKNVCSPPT